MAATAPSNPDGAGGFLPGSTGAAGEYGFDATAVADGVAEGAAGTDEIGAPSGAKDRQVGHAVPDVVELGMAQMAADRRELPGALGVVDAVAGDDRLEEREVRGHRVGDPPVGGGGQDEAPGSVPLAPQELQDIGSIGQGGRIEGDAVAHKALSYA